MKSFSKVLNKLLVEMHIVEQSLKSERNESKHDFSTNNAAKHANEKSGKRDVMVSEAIDDIQESASNIAECSTVILIHQKDTHKINQALEVIKRIVEQTNLLASNINHYGLSC